MKRILNTSFLILSILLCTCSKESPGIKPIDIYITGYQSSNGRSYAGYWKNGTWIEIPSVSPHPNGGNPWDSKTNSVYVSGSDVYFVGSDDLGGKLWKNGIPEKLNGIPYDINGSGSDVYIVGNFEKSAYLKNGVPVNLTGFPSFCSNSSTNSIYITGSDIYIAGLSEFSGSCVLLYWKNGTPFILEQEDGIGSANSIFVSGSDVYVAGWNNYTSEHAPVAKYWKNGIEYDLTDGQKYSFAYSIFVSGRDVYVVGSEDYKAKYWKNGIKYDLTDGQNGSEATSIYVNGSDIYITGYENINGPDFGGNTKFRAILWKNGNKIELDGTNQFVESQATSIFIQTN